jgi:DNA-binding PucR family transcriptional regulator
MHRNSIRYRLQHIRNLTNLDPDDPEERLALQIGALVAEDASEK